MNNESVKSQKNCSIPTTSTTNNSNYSTVNCISSSTTSTTSYSSISSPPSASLSSTQLAYSASAKFDIAVNAIAAVVNASSNLPVTTPPKAAAIVAVAVSSLAAAIIPDTPIVSIAGSTLSEITTTTTSTKTTPTPVPTSKESSNCNSSNSTLENKIDKSCNKKEFANKTALSTSAVNSSSITYSKSKASVKALNPMSVANSTVTGALTNASCTAANAAAPDTENKSANITKIGYKSELQTTPIKSKLITTPTTLTNSSQSSEPTVSHATISESKADNFIVVASKETKSKKDFLSESWEENNLKDLDDSELKELLDEVYSYKNPRDKENKSKTFLQLLEKAENEDQSYPFRVTPRGSRNLSNSIACNSYHYHQNPHYHSHSHNLSHHHHKQGGSLQDLFEVGLHESQLDCDQTFGAGFSGSQRTRRQNHNSRQKKYSSSVSSRQREGGSLPSNVNVTHQLGLGGNGGVNNDIRLMHQEGGTQITATSANISKANKKEQRRNTSKAAAATVAVNSDVKENNSVCIVGESITTSDNSTTTTSTEYTKSGGDFIIDMCEPMVDIQQQQKILQCKGQDASTQGQSFYERLANTDKRIPRANIGSKKTTSFAPTNSHCYIDETVRFNALERNIGTNNGPTSSTMDAKFLPLDENYKSCKSVLGNDCGDKSPEMLSKSNTIYAKMNSPLSGSTVLTGTTNNISTLTQRQFDENGNALNELYPNSIGAGSNMGPTIQINAMSPSIANSSAALINSCGNVSTSATVTISPHTASTTVSTSATVTTTFTSGPSQAKAKAKKKSQQERNTKTVDVESVAGYRGKDPVEELVKYIESSGEDKQTGSSSKSGEKKKERKKDKEKHQKLKKSNSLEELRSGAKMEVHELKRTAATTESNAELVRQKSGAGAAGGKQNKNNLASTVDINKNIEGKSSANTRKSDRRSWGNEDLKYIEDQQNSNLIGDEKTTGSISTNPVKERKSKIGASSFGNVSLTTPPKEEKENKDKTCERNERNVANNIMPTATIQIEKFDKSDKVEEKSEKSDKSDKSEKCEKIESRLDKSEKRKKHEIPSNAVTVVDILAIEPVLPETAEFHVVTKKKKPKKQKVINNLEETTVTFHRSHNFTMQKTSTFNQQQMTVRYKYYHHDNTSNTSISNTNTTNGQNHQQPASQQQHQQSNNFNSNHQYHQQHNPTENFNNTSDASRRKSTSSVPPSEKSDSSDLDSVHSLPIESSKVNNNKNNNNNVVVTTTANPTNKGINIQHRIKYVKNSNQILSSSNCNSVLGKNPNSPAPISYADITRTNKEIADVAAAFASGILINTNEISTECSNVDAIVHNVLPTTTETVCSDDKSAAVIVIAGPITPATATATKCHKIRKAQIKPDFPELASTTVYNDDKIIAANANHKIITYSQSLSAVTNPAQTTTTAIQSYGSCDGVGGSNLVSDFPLSSSSDVNTKASSTDYQKTLIAHQHVHIHPLQHSQQQILQKSKSVENDPITPATSINSSLSSVGTYMTTVNSNNLDQQYPALEKTVKRHSSTNVANTTMIGASTLTNSNNQAPFNFAAAAKQQIARNALSDQHNTDLYRNSALTTSNTNSNTIQPAALLICPSPCTNSSNSVGGPAFNMNKKSKEKISLFPLPVTTQEITQDNAVNANINVPTLTIVNQKRSKKERQQMQQSLLDSSQSKQNQNSSCINLGSSKKPIKTQLKSLNSCSHVLSSSTAAVGESTTISVNRPAVIILNDDRNSGACTADNQFTFGDFNEEELKLFDDDNCVATSDNVINNINNTAALEDEKLYQAVGASSETALKSPTSFNDSGTSYSNDLVNNSTSDMLLSSSIDASSPNTSFVVHSRGNSCEEVTHMPVLCNNQSSDSGIYTDKTKSCNSSCSSSCSRGGAGSNTADAVKQKPKEQISAAKEQNSKLNSFLTNTRRSSVHSSLDNLEPPLPPPQQLETCNDIETAIIAAAREAAKHQLPPDNHPQQQEQQQYINSNNSPDSSSFLSSSLSSKTYEYQHQHHNNNINNNKIYQNQNVSSGSSNMSYHHSEYAENHDDNDNENDDDSSANTTPRSHSPSRPRRISIAGGTVVNKEFDILFIPPTTVPTALSTQQHNDIIIEFIGSAWEEVANSKVTKVYNGQ